MSERYRLTLSGMYKDDDGDWVKYEERGREMRTQRETDLEDEIELLRGQLLSSYARIDELEAEVKLWRDNEQNFPDALNRIDELESLLKGDDL